jgi:hypothetical protein
MSVFIGSGKKYIAALDYPTSQRLSCMLGSSKVRGILRSPAELAGRPFSVFSRVGVK